MKKISLKIFIVIVALFGVVNAGASNLNKQEDIEQFSLYYGKCFSQERVVNLMDSDPDIFIKMTPNLYIFSDSFRPKNTKQRNYRDLLLSRKNIPTDRETALLLWFRGDCKDFDISKIYSPNLRTALKDWLQMHQQITTDLVAKSLTYQQLVFRNLDLQKMQEKHQETYLRYVKNEVLIRMMKSASEVESKFPKMMAKFDVKNINFIPTASASYAPVPKVKSKQVSPSGSIMTTYIGRARAEKERVPLQGRVYQCWNDKITFTTFNNGRKTFVDVTAADYTGMINFRGDYNIADQTFEGTHKFSRYWAVNVRGEIEGDYASGSVWYTISNSPGWNTDVFCISHFKVYKKDT